MILWPELPNNGSSLIVVSSRRQLIINVCSFKVTLRSFFLLFMILFWSPSIKPRFESLGITLTFHHLWPIFNVNWLGYLLIPVSIGLRFTLKKSPGEGAPINWPTNGSTQVKMIRKCFGSKLLQMVGFFTEKSHLVVKRPLPIWTKNFQRLLCRPFWPRALF